MKTSWKQEGHAHHPTWWSTTYCCSHGAGSHADTEYNNKRLGHKADTTAKTRMGGITLGFPQGLRRLGYDTSNLNFTNNELNLENLTLFSKTKTACSVNPPTNLEQYGIDNTGATQNYIRVNTLWIKNQPIKNYPQVILPDGNIMQTTHRALINLKPLLTQAYRTSHMSPHLKSGSLIAIGKLYNDGCIATFTATW